MGFFKNIFKKPNIARIATAVSTFGTSEAVRAVAKAANVKVVTQAANIYSKVYSAGTAAVADRYTGGAYSAVVAATQNRPTNLVQQPVQGGVQPMGLNLGGILGQVSGIFGGSQNPYFQTVSNIAGLASSFTQQQAFRPNAGPMMVSNQSTNNLPAVIPSGPGRSALTKDIFDAGAKILARLGINLTTVTNASVTSALKRALGSIASLARRTPSGTIVSILLGLGLTVMESNTLVAWYAQKKKHRRMNICNAKALRRAGRRIRSFHKLCQHLDLKKTVHHRK